MNFQCHMLYVRILILCLSWKYQLFRFFKEHKLTSSWYLFLFLIPEMLQLLILTYTDTLYTGCPSYARLPWGSQTLEELKKSVKLQKVAQIFQEHVSNWRYSQSFLKYLETPENVFFIIALLFAAEKNSDLFNNSWVLEAANSIKWFLKSHWKKYLKKR